MSKLIQTIIVTALVFGLFGCVFSSVVPLAPDVIRVRIVAADVCSILAVDQLAFQQAARETILRGFDSFVILSGSSSTVVVKMFKESDQLESDVLSARAVLGEDWMSIVEKGFPKTCL